MKTILAILTLTAALSFTQSKAVAHTNLVNDTLNTVSVDLKIQQKFQKANPGVLKAMWQPMADGYTASFKSGDVNHTWVYNEKHRIGYQIKTYDKSHLPKQVVNRITNAYSEYDIESAEEINILGHTYFHVRIASNKFRKLLKMDENEILTVETMRRYYNL